LHNIAEHREHLPRIDLKEYRRTSDSISIEDIAPEASDMRKMVKMNCFNVKFKEPG